MHGSQEMRQGQLQSVNGRRLNGYAGQVHRPSLQEALVMLPVLGEVVSHGTFVSTMNTLHAPLAEAGQLVIEPELRRQEGHRRARAGAVLPPGFCSRVVRLALPSLRK